MSKKLILMNGRWSRGEHAYIAAYSIADAIRMCEEVVGGGGWRGEINNYFAKCWGNAMGGIAPERGIWIQATYHDKPEKIF